MQKGYCQRQRSRSRVRSRLELEHSSDSLKATAAPASRFNISARVIFKTGNKVSADSVPDSFATTATTGENTIDFSDAGESRAPADFRGGSPSRRFAGQVIRNGTRMQRSDFDTISIPSARNSPDRNLPSNEFLQGFCTSFTDLSIATASAGILLIYGSRTPVFRRINRSLERTVCVCECV